MKIFCAIKIFLCRIFDFIYFKIENFLNKRKFSSFVIEMAKKGVFTANEKKIILDQCKLLNLTISDLKKIRALAFKYALNAEKPKRKITANQEIQFKEMQQFLMIPDNEIIEAKADLARLRILTEIENGTPPITYSPNIPLQKNEIAYWSESANLFELRVTSRETVGGSRGATLTLAKGLSFRVGNQRGQVISHKTAIPVSQGELIITNKRLVFNGDLKSFNLRLDKIFGVNFGDDGLIFNVDNRQKPYIIEFNMQENVDVINGTLSLALNNFVI